ncbi:MAG TPA: hypothetical protein VFW87_17610 [Pirellulales bacterium]|nr:hypothetical protein [Pirellulales bacterium]
MAGRAVTIPRGGRGRSWPQAAWQNESGPSASDAPVAVAVQSLEAWYDAESALPRHIAMRLNLRTISRYRPRLLTVMLLIVIAALLVLSNLSDEIRPRHQEKSKSPAELGFQSREADGPYQGGIGGMLLNVSYGWPLLWRQYVIVHGYGLMNVIGECHSRSRLLVTFCMRLVLLIVPAAACEWLLRHYQRRLRWSLRTMLAAVALAAALCSWAVTVRQRATVQEALIAAVIDNHGAAW